MGTEGRLGLVSPMALDTDPQGWVKALAFRLRAFDRVEPGVQGGLC